MLPQGLSQVRSQARMRAVQPEVEKLKKKYGDARDPATKQKMRMEQQELYRKHKINPLGGCLQMLLTMPIFIAFIGLMQRVPIYITEVRVLYEEIGRALVGVPGLITGRTVGEYGEIIPGSPFFELLASRTTPDLVNGFYARHGEFLDPGRYDHLPRFIDKISRADIRDMVSAIDESYYYAEGGIRELLNKRDQIQTFLGLNLVQAVNADGWLSPAIIIPILSAATSFLLSYITTKLTPQTDANAKTQRMMMMIVMPAMMFFFTLNVSGGVGVYWIAGNLLMILQQVLLVKFYVNKKFGAGDGNASEIKGKARDVK